MNSQLIIIRILNLIFLISGAAFLAVGDEDCWSTKKSNLICFSRSISAWWRTDDSYLFGSKNFIGQYIIFSILVIFSFLVLLTFLNVVSYAAETLIATLGALCLIGCLIGELYYYFTTSLIFPLFWRISMVCFFISIVMFICQCKAASGVDSRVIHNTDVEFENNEPANFIKKDWERQAMVGNEESAFSAVEMISKASTSASDWKTNYISAFEYS